MIQASSLSLKRFSRMFLAFWLVSIFSILSADNQAAQAQPLVADSSLNQMAGTGFTTPTKLGKIQPGEQQLQGFLSAIHEDYYLHTAAGKAGAETLQLRLSAEMRKQLGENSQQFLHKNVQLTGTTSKTRYGEAIFVVSSIESKESKSLEPGEFVVMQDAQTAAITGNKPFVTILCRFKYNTFQPQPKSWFEGLMGATYPGLNHYYQTVSNGLLNLNNSFVATASGGNYYELNQPRSYYIKDSDPNRPGEETDWIKLRNECIAEANPYLDFSQYYGINLQFNSTLGAQPAGGDVEYMTLDNVTRNWGVTWIGYDAANSSVMSQATYAHEMGHAFGLPHSANIQGDTYKDAYDLMGEVFAGCLQNQRDPSYGCIAQYPNAYHTALMGWYPSGRYGVINAVFDGRSYTYDLYRPGATEVGKYALKIANPASAADVHFTLEVRRRVTGTYDYNIPANGVVIHKVYPNLADPSRLVVASGDPDDVLNQNAVWKQGQFFRYTYSNGDTITVEVLEFLQYSGYKVKITLDNFNS